MQDKQIKNMKKIILATLFLGASNVFAQPQNENPIDKDISLFEKSIEEQKQEIDKLTSKVNSQQATINQQLNSLNEIRTKATLLESTVASLGSLIDTNRSNINVIENDLGTKIQETGQQAETRISELGGDVEKNRLYWIIASLATILLGGIVYWLLGKRIKTSKSDVETQIRNTKKSLEEESLKLDGALVKVFQKQLEVLENSSKGASQDEDHSLVLKIADRLTAMETNLYRMDFKTPGVNTLKTLIRSTKENFNAKEYEIVEMLGKEYKEGMEVIATFIPSDEIEIGKQIITRVIKPQVNFKGQKIQAAQIEVSIGE